MLATRYELKRVIGVGGCVAQQEGTQILRRSKEVDVIVGTQNLKRLPMLVTEAAAAPRRRAPLVDLDPLGDVSFPLGIARRQDPLKAYVTIIEGCNDHCAFCVVPYTRGHERMRRKEDVLAEVREAAAGGRREIQLLGQIVNHYQAPDDPACDFAQLLAEVNEVPGVERIRFASPHPRHTGERLIAAVRDLPKCVPYLHVPAQSGSNRVLERMKRGYTVERYLNLVEKLRARIPSVAIATGLVATSASENCCCRWISWKSRALWMALAMCSAMIAMSARSCSVKVRRVGVSIENTPIS